ncbi:leucine Rich Repeat family protein [Loa loa]|uniref:Leucine Rich Repeat family protein n=2 Tax=Loa loa TaxID=7209 RepID=A0A1S0UC39_LOALO|nr:leucine Rich Repeat family protein [Loa loa]EFO28405.1 leucine Rich Repeat family protein [Loa loa]
MAVLIGSDIISNVSNNGNSCRQDTQSNRCVYECINVTFQNISPIPSGIMILRISNSVIKHLLSLNSTEIVTVMMNFCNLSDISLGASIFAINLGRLDLLYNLLKTLKFKNDSHFFIRNLIISHNDFVAVPLLYSLQQLTQLDLSHNKIRYLAGYDLLLPKLEVVNLSYNQLHVVKSMSFGDMMPIIELDGCPRPYDCHLRDFVIFQRKTLDPNHRNVMNQYKFVVSTGMTSV